MAETVGVRLTSVVVPTRDRPHQLGRCLAALERQTASDFEVIVVDDGSANPAAVEEVVRDRPQVRLVRQAGAGPAAARNRGVRAARGTYICFTDDDCEPQPEWVERLAGSLSGGAAAAAGVTLSGSPQNPLAEASELIAAALSFPAHNGGEGLPFAPSNNLGCRTDLLTAIPFDETFPVAAGEDRDWCARLRAAGHVLVRESAAVVIHRQQLHFDDFWNQQVRYGRGAFRFRSAIGARSLEPPMFYARLVRQGFRRGVRTGLLVGLAQVGTAIGFIAEWKTSRAAFTGGRTR